jgi:hypothetical protein
MESIMTNTELNENFTIQGDNDQSIQFLLKKNESIVCKKSVFHYSSSQNLEETQYYKILEVKESQKDKTTNNNNNLGILLKNPNLIRLKNSNNFFEYVGLYNSGKIVTINPFLYNELFIRYDTLIGFTDSIELYENKQITRMLYKFQYHENLFNTENRFYMIHSGKSKQISEFKLSDYNLLKEYVFLSSESKNN